ncbi:hypothetical protein VAA_03489 [Vibrio anguillarum 775]|nr:hypothetical protein VAA_03489 [Vibrio anguillarum 775]ARV25859.1 hypothetical protein A6A12_1929 [Vibrio anguillarum]
MLNIGLPLYRVLTGMPVFIDTQTPAGLLFSHYNFWPLF